MTFPYLGSNTGLFTRIGHIGYLLNSLNAFIGNKNLSAGGIESVGSGIDEIYNSFTQPDTNLIGGLYSARDTYRSAHAQMQTYLQNLSQSVAIQMVNDFSPLAQQTLASALTFLINQMKTDAQTVNKPTVSASTTAGGSNTGAGVLAAGVFNELGVQKDYVIAETITASCTADGQTGGTAGQEAFAVTSPIAETNALQWDWPLGSGISVTANAVDATVDNGGGNLLQNGSWKQWTNPAIGPDNWLILTGAVGTQITQAAGNNVYKGASGLTFVGDATTLTSISQPFAAALSTAGNAGGTTAKLAPLTHYCLNLWLKVSSVPAAGVLAIDLTDGSNNVLSDYSGNANTLSLNLTGATTGWVAHNVFFRTPAVVPSTGYRLRVRLSTALSAGVSLYLGNMALAVPALFYAGGPRFAIFSGNPNFIKGDTFSVAVANNYASQWQLLADRLFGMKALGLQLPSSATPTIADATIV